MSKNFRNSLVLTITAASILLSSCAKKNVVNSTGKNSSFFVSGNPAVSANFINYYNSIKSKVSCTNGRYRLNNDYTFSTASGNVSQLTLYSNSWTNGMLSSGAGTVSEMYVGRSNWGDLLFVTKVVNGSGSVVGYNATISYCSVPNYSNYPALVSNERQISLNYSTGQSIAQSFSQYGITLQSNAGCGYGLILAAFNTVTISQKIMGNPYTEDFPLVTTFYANSCF